MNRDEVQKWDVVTRGITYLLTDTFQAIVIESTFSLLFLGKYIYCHEPHRVDTYPDVAITFLFSPFHFGNISISRHRASLLTIPIFGLCHNSFNSVNSETVI